jgi:hypothetical protein
MVVNKARMVPWGSGRPDGHGLGRNADVDVPPVVVDRLARDGVVGGEHALVDHVDRVWREPLVCVVGPLAVCCDYKGIIMYVPVAQFDLDGVVIIRDDLLDGRAEPILDIRMLARSLVHDFGQVSP